MYGTRGVMGHTPPFGGHGHPEPASNCPKTGRQHHMKLETTGTIQDPVCGMSVNEKTAAASSAYNGHQYYFCCLRCRDRFEQQPEAYIRTTPSLPMAGSERCGCGENTA